MAGSRTISLKALLAIVTVACFIALAMRLCGREMIAIVQSWQLPLWPTIATVVVVFTAAVVWGRLYALAPEPTKIATVLGAIGLLGVSLVVVLIAEARESARRTGASHVLMDIGAAVQLHQDLHGNEEIDYELLERQRAPEPKQR